MVLSTENERPIERQSSFSPIVQQVQNIVVYGENVKTLHDEKMRSEICNPVVKQLLCCTGFLIFRSGKLK